MKISALLESFLLLFLPSLPDFVPITKKKVYSYNIIEKI